MKLGAGGSEQLVQGWPGPEDWVGRGRLLPCAVTSLLSHLSPSPWELWSLLLLPAVPLESPYFLTLPCLPC